MYLAKSKIVFILLLPPTLILILYWSSVMTVDYRGGTFAITSRMMSFVKGSQETFEVSKSSPAKATQKVRKQTIKEYCLKHTYKKSPTKKELKFVIVDDEHKIIFCAIPKVASTTWKRVLADLRGLKQGIFVHRPSLWRRLGDYSEEEQSHRLKNYFKFMFVREPLHRILSAFKDKFNGKNRYFSNNIRKLIVKALRPEDFDKNGDNNVTFTEFVQYFSKDIPRNPHWRQYEPLCHPCVINYDFIGQLESLAEDAPLLLKMAGIDDHVHFPPIHNATSSYDMVHYYSKVPPEYVIRLAELYHNDFEIFGYEFLGPVKKLLNQSLVDRD